MYEIDWILLTGVLLFFLWFIYVLEEVNWLENDLLSRKPYLILVVQNQEKTIEGIIRKLFFFDSRLMYGTTLIIADLNSQDKTPEIIKRMCYPVNCFNFVQLENQVELDNLLERYGRENCVVLNYCDSSQK